MLILSCTSISSWNLGLSSDCSLREAVPVLALAFKRTWPFLFSPSWNTGSWVALSWILATMLWEAQAKRRGHREGSWGTSVDSPMTPQLTVSANCQPCKVAILAQPIQPPGASACVTGSATAQLSLFNAQNHKRNSKIICFKWLHFEVER